MATRGPRYGLHTYAVSVSSEVSPTGVLYLKADSLTVTGGALMLSAEMFPLEAFTEGDEPDPRAGIDLPPTTIIAPGHWYSVRMVDEELRPMFVSGDSGDSGAE